MIEVQGWLEQLGLGQYTKTFAEQKIGGDVLPELTDHDREKLGIPVGVRTGVQL